MKRFLLAGVAIVAVAAGGLALVGGSAGAQTPADARVRVAHLSPDAPNVDVYANDNAVLTDVPYGTVSDYLTVPGGAYNFKVFATGADPDADDPVIDADATLAAGKDYTVAAVGLVAEIEPAVFEDNNAAPAAGKAHVRVIHASPDAPNVDIAVAGGPVVFSDLAFPNAAGPSPVDAGSYDLEVRAAGTTTVAVALNDVALESGMIYTVIAAGLVEGEPALEAITVIDEPRATGAPPTPAPTTAAPAPQPTESHSLPSTGTGSSGSDGGSMWAILALGAAAVGGTAGGAGLAFRRTK